MSLSSLHPCQRCGACCASFRVSFYWGEAGPFGTHGVPEDLTLQVSPHRVAMRGTERTPPRCMALQGNPGESVACTIYQQRPSPCRAFEPSWEKGAPNEACDRARARLGLAALTPDNFLSPRRPPSAA